MSIQTTIHDVVFSGHGGIYIPPSKTCRVPPGVEFWMLGPPGAMLQNYVGQMLETGEKIEGLFLKKPSRWSYTRTEPNIYAHGAELPDLMLKFGNFVPRDKKTVPHILTVSETVHLADIWERIDPFRTVSLKAGRTLRVFWGACAELDHQTDIYQIGATNHPLSQYYYPA